MTEPLARTHASTAPAEPPPLLQTWPRLYAAVLLSQIAFAVLLWALGAVTQGVAQGAVQGVAQ